MLEALTRSLETSGPLSDGERAALARLESRTRRIEAGRDLVAPGSCAVVLSGLLCTYVLLQQGRREILALHVPGDACDLQQLVLESEVNFCALTPVEVGLIARSDLTAVMEKEPGIAQAVWRRSAADGLVWRQWMASLGRRDAYGRVGAPLLRAADPVRGGGFGGW